MQRKSRTPESFVLEAILDYLAAEHILAFRLNTGAVKTEGRFIRFGTPGMADIIASPVLPWMYGISCPRFLWIESKAPTGKQSELQKSFQRQVEEAGHSYLIAKSVDDVEEWLKKEGR